MTRSSSASTSDIKTPVKIYVDRPANIWSPNQTGMEEHRAAYTQLLASLLVSNHPFEFVQMRPFAHQSRAAALENAIYYAYHADSPGENTYCFKGGPFPNLWYMDKGGYSGWCEMANSPGLQDLAAEYPLANATQAIAKIYAKMQKENSSNQAQPEGCRDIGGLRDFVFYPLQVNNDSVMALTRHRQAEVIATLGLQAAATGRPLVIKRHPLCDSQTITDALNAAGKHDTVLISQGSVNALLDRAHSVVVTNSSVGFQALVARKPVYALGQSEYAHMCTQIDELAQLSAAFDPAQPKRSERVTRQLGYMIDEYFVDITNPAQMTSRLDAHISAYLPSATQAAFDAEDAHARVFLTAAHALNKQVHEQVDFLLSQYAKAKEAAREQMAPSLIRLTRAGYQMPRILAATDGNVSARVMRHHLKSNDWDTAQEVAEELLDRAPKGADAALRQLLEAAKKANETGWLVDIAARAAQSESASFGTLMLFVEIGLEDGAPSSEQLYRALTRAYAMRPKNAKLAWMEARIALRDAQYDDALTAINVAIKLDPKDKSYELLRDTISQKKDKHSTSSTAKEPEKLISN